MDDIYEHLDNFNDENRIAELQTENKDLKLKLEEYESAVAKLQEDLDRLSSEYKKLELNYSSLLKTAKSEIERKTEIIKNLNKEKDEMVLNSLQNKHSFNRSFNNFKHNDKNQNIKSEKNILKPEIDNKTLTRVVTMDRTDKSQLSSKDTPNSHIDLRSKLLSLSKTIVDVGPTMKNNDITKNVSNSEADESCKARALIKNRRKSMPAVRPEIERYSSDDENLAYTRNIRDNVSRESSREKRDRLHHNYSETTNSRTSETPSLEDRRSGYKDQTHRTRQRERCDWESYRTRSKSSHRNRRYSPDRPYRGPRTYHDEHRSDHDKHRFLENTNYRNYNHARSREPHRDNFDRKHSQERIHRNHDRLYPMKHKIHHNSDEVDNKRIKIDAHYKQFEENQRLKNERDYLENRYIPQPQSYDDIQFSSCESPDYNYADPHHQVREIKFNATTKLDDPRISHQKYVVQNNNGKMVLSTTEGRNVDIIPLTKSAWGIKPIKMPDALMQRPPNMDVVFTKIKTVAEIPPKLPMESGEISDELSKKNTSTQALSNKTEILKCNKIKTPPSNPIELKETDDFSLKFSSYKIPKQKKPGDEQSNINIQESILGKLLHENTTKKKTKVSNSDENKLLNKSEKNHDTVPSQSKNDLPILCSIDTYDKHDNVTAMKVVQDDLELSDDTCDNCDESKQVSKENLVGVASAKKNERDKNRNIYPEPTCENDKTTVSSETKPIKLKIQLNKEEGKKKSKRKTKHKEAKEDVEKVPVDVTEKAIGKKSKETKTKEIKTKFCELFGDSGSLITPEDLGLTSVPAATTRLPDQCVPFFEDAQDAVDIKEAQTPKDSITIDKPHDKEPNQNDNKNMLVNVGLKSAEKKNGLRTTSNEEPVEIIYKNLETIPDKPNDVKTVIISSGVQPQISLEAEEQEVLAKKGHPIRPRVHEIAMKALATSTPHKYEPNVSTESKVFESAQSCDSDSRLVTDQAPPFDNSIINTMDSQTKDNDAPDVRIFMKRRRRFVKK